MLGRAFNPTPIVVAIVVAQGLAIYVLVSTLPRYLAEDPTRVDTSSTIISAIGLIAAAGAAVAAFATIYQQHLENRRQREVQTLHLLNEQYDKIFADIYALRREAVGSCTKCGAQNKISDDAIRGIYTRYFTALATGVRYFQTGLIPRDDFVDWTANLIARLGSERCLVQFDGACEEGEIRRRWDAFDRRIFGPRTKFRAYMTAVWAAASTLPKERSPERDSALTATAEKISDALSER